MNGMEMMLKSMGINVDAIKEIAKPESVKKIVDTMLQASETLDSIDKRLLRIEIKLETMPSDEAIKLLADGKDSAEKETVEYVRANTDRNSYN